MFFPTLKLHYTTKEEAWHMLKQKNFVSKTKPLWQRGEHPVGMATSNLHSCHWNGSQSAEREQRERLLLSSKDRGSEGPIRVKHGWNSTTVNLVAKYGFLGRKWCTSSQGCHVGRMKEKYRSCWKSVNATKENICWFELWNKQTAAKSWVVWF